MSYDVTRCRLARRQIDACRAIVQAARAQLSRSRVRARARRGQSMRDGARARHGAAPPMGDAHSTVGASAHGAQVNIAECVACWSRANEADASSISGKDLPARLP